MLNFEFLNNNDIIIKTYYFFHFQGLQSEKDDYPYLFGTYEYKENSTALQYFSVQNIENNKIPYKIVELRIETNHGNEKYTCLYRFRVHGVSTYYEFS